MPDIDAVSICVPNKLHAGMSIDAFEAGKHVLCEKPLAINALEAQRIVDAARANGKLLMVAFNNRFAASSRAIKAFVDQGLLGPIHYARATWLRRDGIPGFGSWFTTREVSGGGVLIDVGIHMLDLALYFMGYPQPVSVLGSTYREFGTRGKGLMLGGPAKDLANSTFDVEDLAIGLVKLANGATLVVEASWAGHQQLADDKQIRLFGRDGGAHLVMPNDDSADTVHVTTEIAGQQVDLSPRFTFNPDDSYYAEVRHFVECIREGRETLAPGEQGVTLMRIVDALYESAATGKQVLLAEQTPA